MTHVFDIKQPKPLLEIKQLNIEGFDGEQWKPIVLNMDLHLKRGEVLGLIGESGAGKSTLGLAAMGYAQIGCRIASGSICFDGLNLITEFEQSKRDLRGSRIAYVAQSAAASFNPAHKLIDQFAEGPVQHGLMSYRLQILLGL
jgi:peptide/nickel transport system ATP-binding protein